MTSIFTATSEASSASPNFYVQLKSILPSTTSPPLNFASDSTPLDFLEWKRKIKCPSESDYIALPKLDASHCKADVRGKSGFLKNSFGTDFGDAESSYSRIRLFQSQAHDNSELCTSNPLKSTNLETRISSPIELSSTFSRHLAHCFRVPSIECSGSASSAFIPTDDYTTSQPSVTTVPAKNFSSSRSLSHGLDRSPCKKVGAGQRKNIWKNQTYADLICRAILSSPNKRLTLSQIYDWLIENIDYFKTKRDGKSSVGWKNSIRHNLSLHSRFVRVQGLESGKSSWWTVDLTAKPSRRCKKKPPREEPSKPPDYRAPPATSASLAAAKLPTFFRHQTIYDGYHSVDNQFRLQNSFYRHGKEDWQSGYARKPDLPFHPQKNSPAACYFPRTDDGGYSGCCYSTPPFLPSALSPIVDPSRINEHGTGKETTDPVGSFPSDAANRYDDYFYFKGPSSGLPLSKTHGDLPSFGSIGNASRRGPISDKALPSLFSSLYEEAGRFGEFRGQGHAGYAADTCSYYDLGSSRYYRRDQTILQSEDGNPFSLSYHHRRPQTVGQLEGVKGSIAEANLGVT